jgi:hypothetical protein
MGRGGRGAATKPAAPARTGDTVPGGRPSAPSSEPSPGWETVSPRPGIQSPPPNAASNDAVGGSKSYRFSVASASGAPASRSIPASSHSTETGPS